MIMVPAIDALRCKEDLLQAVCRGQGASRLSRPVLESQQAGSGFYRSWVRSINQDFLLVHHGLGHHWLSYQFVDFLHFSTQTLTEMELSTTSGTGGNSCTLLDRSVGFKCLASLMGVGGSRLEKKASGAPDLRYGRREHRSKPGTWTVDSFLQIQYDAVAETLPDEYLG